MRLFNAAIFIIAFLLGISAYADKNKLVVTGSSTIAPLALELAKAFENKYPGTRIEVQTGGSTRGLIDARQGNADIGMVSRSLKPSENDLFASAIAKDGISIILHKSNKVKTLTNKQILMIFKKEIINWKTLGGSDSQIVVVNKAEGRSTLELFLKYFKLKNNEIKADIIIGDNEQGVKTVSNNPLAIGYVSIGTAEFDINLGTPIKLMPILNVPATTKNVELGTFPLNRTLNFVTKQKPSGLQEKFINYARSANARKIIKNLSFIPVKN